MPVGDLLMRQLNAQEYLLLRTYDNHGRAVDTPVWFAERDGILYIETAKDLGKVQRIRQNPRVSVVPCTYSGEPLGAAYRCRARVVSDAEEIFKARGALTHKYGFRRQLYLFALVAQSLITKRLIEAIKPQAYLAIEPELIV